MRRVKERRVARLGADMRIGATIAALAGALLPAGCHQAAPPATPAPHPHYAVGRPWQGEQGVWFYPSEHFGGTFSGLAVPTDAPAGTLATDGEAHDPALATAAVQALQLPCVLRVTNLANGRQILVRAVDQGPASPARLIGLNARARTLLGMGEAPTAIRFEIEGEASQTLAASLGGGPHVAVAAAPLGAVSETSLPPPGAAAPAPVAAASMPGAADAGPPPPLPPLPQTVSQLPAEATRLWLDAGTFTGRAPADSVAAAIGGTVETDGEGRNLAYRVRRGPFTTVPAADAALDQALRAGISGTRIVAE